MHLVWHYNQIFIKPVPKYLLSYAFWQYLAVQPAEFREAAIGFMRTYSYLVRYETDFSIAREKGLIPENTSSSDGKDLITWDSFARLVASFDKFDDEAVSPRYSYGELRLTRLNFYSRIFLRKLTYHHIEAQWGTFLNSFLTPFIIVFVIVASILNAMQAEWAVQGIDDIDPRWVSFANLSKWFCVIILALVAFVVFLVMFLVVIMFLHDLYFASRIITEKKRDPHGESWRTRKSGVV